MAGFLVGYGYQNQTQMNQYSLTARTEASPSTRARNLLRAQQIPRSFQLLQHNNVPLLLLLLLLHNNGQQQHSDVQQQQQQHNDVQQQLNIRYNNVQQQQ